MEDVQKYLGFYLDKLTFIGQGLEGRVYLLPKNKVLKVFLQCAPMKASLRHFYEQKTAGSFPLFMIMEIIVLL